MMSRKATKGKKEPKKKPFASLKDTKKLIEERKKRNRDAAEGKFTKAKKKKSKSKNA